MLLKPNCITVVKMQTAVYTAVVRINHKAQGNIQNIMVIRILNKQTEKMVIYSTYMQNWIC